MGGQSGKIKTAKLWMRFIVIKMSGTLRKHLQDIVEHLIIAGEENDRVDFKETYYHENKKSDMIKDIISFANGHCQEDKYIIFGVRDADRKVVGINRGDIPDISEINQFIQVNCEPYIFVEMQCLQIMSKEVAVMIIKKENREKPYTVKKDYTNRSGGNIQAGDIFIRKGANNFKALRNDIEDIYKTRTILDINIINGLVGFKDEISVRSVKKLGIITVTFINDTEYSILFNKASIIWLYSDTNIESDVLYIEDDLSNCKVPVDIRQKPYLLKDRTQDQKNLYFSVSEGFYDIIIVRAASNDMPRIELRIVDARGILRTTTSNIEKIVWNE